MNSEQGKKCKNVNPVDQMIDNMTGDKQNPFSLSPPITNDNVNWVDFQQNQCQSNPFVPQFNQRQPDGINFPIEPNPRFVPQNFGNYIPQNIYMQQNYGEKLGNDGIGNKKYVMYRGTAPQYVLANPELSQVYGYVPVIHENRDFRLFSPNEMQNIPIQTNSMLGNDHEANFPQNHTEPINLVHQNIQKTPNCTHLIDNVVSKWNQNTNGTYSPFGTVQNNPPTSFYDNDTQNSVPIIENPQNFHEIPEKTDFNTISFKTNNNLKKKQVAEVKPMRPTYSDVLTKSVNSQTPKFEKNDPQNPKNKSSLKKSAKISKINNLTRQNSNNNENQNNLSAKFEKSEKINNLGRKWVSLDDVNEMNHTNLFKDVSDNKNTNIKNKNPNFITSNNTKKFENTAKSNENNFPKNGLKKGFLDSSSTLGCQWSENSDENFSESYLKNEDKNFGKNPSKKGKESRSNSLRQLRERGNEKPPGSAKRNQRMRKRENHGSFATIGRTLQHYLSKWSKVVFKFLLWLLHLISDIFSMSVHLTRDFGVMLWDNIVLYSKSFAESVSNIFKKVTIFSKIGGYLDRVFGEYSWAFWRKNENEHQNIKTEGKNWLNSGLEHNIQMPQTGEEAMKRLLACKGKDPYSILGVRPDCSDDDIKKYYKRQAFLVHPDKNPQPGAEEAFKILVHAFDIIGEPERRQSYDRKVAESHQVEQAWSELNDLLSQLQTKMEYAANTIRCTNCSKRHRRLNVNRPCYAARNCAQCKIHHSAKEGDIWAESKYFGFYWHYYACMDGAVYDITEWAGCQRKNLKHLRPNSHNVQYRIVLGKQGQTGGPSREKRHKNSTNNTDREADLENFLNNLYNQSDLSNGAQSPTHSDLNARNSTESAKCRKKNKRKK